MNENLLKETLKGIAHSRVYRSENHGDKKYFEGAAEAILCQASNGIQAIALNHFYWKEIQREGDLIKKTGREMGIDSNGLRHLPTCMVCGMVEVDGVLTSDPILRKKDRPSHGYLSRQCAMEYNKDDPDILKVWERSVFPHEACVEGARRK